MKIIKNIIAILFIISVFTLFPINEVHAATDISPTSVIQGGKDFLSDGDTGYNVFNEQAQQEGVDTIYYTFLTISIVVAVLIGGILAVQFITSGAAGQAKVKEKLIPYAIGAFVVFGAFAIWKIAYGILNSVMPQ